jgi:hypothetical protein
MRPLACPGLALVLALPLVALAPACASPSDDEPVTGLTVTVRYQGPRIATISLDGEARASGRDIGPYTLSTRELVSGGSVGLVFDPSDAGDLRLCADALDSDGDRRDRTCTNATLVANRVVTAALALSTAPF